MSGSRPAIRLAVAVVAALVFSFGTASARLPKPPVCRDGRFVTAPGAPPLLAGATVTVPEAVVVEGGTSTIAIAGHCPAVQVRLRGTSRGTKVTASWPKNACGPAKVRLRATIDPGCHAMRGVLRPSKSPPTRFVAPRCGDGIMDTVAGEACDGDAGCGASQECSPDCRCVDLTRPPITPAPVSFSGEVQPIFSARCAIPFCHSGAVPTQGLDLSAGRSYAGIVNRPSTERPGLKIVDGGAPDMSYLEWKIGGAPLGQSILESPMPLTGGPLSAAERAIIRRWIAEGALDDLPVATTSTSTTLATVPTTSTTVTTLPSTSTTTSTVTSTTTTSTTTTSTTTTQPATAVSFRGDVQPIFTARCAVAFCHSGPFPTQGLNLGDGSSYAAIVGQPSTELLALKLVDPSSETNSYLLWKISNAPPGETIMGSPMPLTGGPLTLTEMATIRTWVTDGALDN